jgi:hypothetical protein
VRARDGNKASVESAITAFEKVVALDPTWALDHANLAALYRQKGDLVRARSEIQKAVELAPNCAAYLLNLGVITEESGDSVAARSAYTKVLGLEPNWRAAWFWRNNEFRKKVLSEWQDQNPEAPQTLEEKLAFLDSRKSFLGAYLPVLADYELRGDLSSGKSLIDRAVFGFVDFAWQDAELNWYQAELASENGDVHTAGISGMQAVQAWRLTSLLGIGTYGKANYNSYSYRRRELIREVVPQMETIPMPDTWGRRAYRVAQWLRQSGESTKADEIMTWLEEDIPDWSQVLQIH